MDLRRLALPALSLFSLGVLSIGTRAWADAVRVQYSTRVVAGEHPRMTFLTDEPIDALAVDLRDDEGQTVHAAFGPLPRGARREVELPEAPGRRHYQGQVTVTQRGRASQSPLSFEAVVAPRLEITIDRARVDLTGRALEARLNRPAAKAEIKIFSATGSGAPLAEAEQPFDDAAAGAPLVIHWPEAPGEIGRIDLRLTDVDGFYAGVSLFPWSVYIPHEEVGFATDSTSIAPNESPKLEASYGLIAAALAQHRGLGPIKLYIAGHTDTVGSEAYNLRLSQRRAQAIAAWFRKRGLRLPILFEGFGEQAPRVATADETNEPRNRRVDYILAVDEPVLKATRFKASWKAVP